MCHCNDILYRAREMLSPPVIAALLGTVIAVSPVRGLFVDLEHRANNAPLEWIFDGA